MGATVMEARASAAGIPPRPKKSRRPQPATIPPLETGVTVPSAESSSDEGNNFGANISSLFRGGDAESALQLLESAAKSMCDSTRSHSHPPAHAFVSV